MIKVIKRDNSVVDFNKEKIVNAINRAFLEVDGKLYETDTAQDIATEIEKLGKHLDVEEIQDYIEDALMRSERRDVAKAYVRYRYKREVARNYSDDFIKALKEKLEAKNVQNQNANVDEHSFGGRKGEATDLLMKKYALDFCVSPMARENHENNIIYIHDLSDYAVGSHNCLSIPFDDLLAKGFKTRQCDVRPAQSVNTAFQLLAVIFQLQSLQQFGGVSATHLDWTMVPYVRKSFYKHYLNGALYVGHKDTQWIQQNIYDIVNDAECFSSEQSIDSDWWKAEKDIYQYAIQMTRKEIYQAVEGMYHNLNTLQSRSGNQLPFTSINYGTCTLPEGRMVTKALLEVLIEGLGPMHKTSIFPCGIFQCMKGVNQTPGEPNYDLFRIALESTAKRLYPNYANVDWSGNAGYDINDPRTYFSTMGKCKLQLI